jgi:hypothetical protein
MFRGTINQKIPNEHKIYQRAIKYIPKMAEKETNGHQIYQYHPLQGPPKFTHIGILV